MCGIQLAVKLVVYIHEAYKSYNDVFLRVERALLREAASKQNLVSWGRYGVIVYKVSAAIQSSI